MTCEGTTWNVSKCKGKNLMKPHFWRVPFFRIFVFFFCYIHLRYWGHRIIKVELYSFNHRQCTYLHLTRYKQLSESVNNTKIKKTRRASMVAILLVPRDIKT